MCDQINTNYSQSTGKLFYFLCVVSVRLFLRPSRSIRCDVITRFGSPLSRGRGHLLSVTNASLTSIIACSRCSLNGSTQEPITLVYTGTWLCHMRMRPNKAETAVHGCHCSGDMAMGKGKVLVILRSCVVSQFKIGFSVPGVQMVGNLF